MSALTLHEAAMVALSEWIDAMPVHRRLSLETRARIDKIAEEYGEVIEAVIGYEGANSRKGVTHEHGDIVKELLDVALAALGAVEHMTGNNGDSLALLDRHIIVVGERAGVVGQAGAVTA